MPTQWTLSIMPADGWVPQSWMFCIAACSVGFALLVVVAAFMALRIRRMRQRIEREKRIDQETGMFTYDAALSRRSIRQRAARGSRSH